MLMNLLSLQYWLENNKKIINHRPNFYITNHFKKQNTSIKQLQQKFKDIFQLLIVISDNKKPRGIYETQSINSR